MSYRKILKQVQGTAAIDGAGVHLHRVLGRPTIEDYDPFLMLDSFDSRNPEDYEKGFPLHPHRGIETITYLYAGGMTHRDSLGNEDSITGGEVQWMTAGSGIMHEEMPQISERMLGVQIWLNLPAKNKMVDPAYKKITQNEMLKFEEEDTRIELITGAYKDHKAPSQPQYSPLDFYHIEMKEGALLELPTKEKSQVVLFTLEGEIAVLDEDGNAEIIPAKTAVTLSEGNLLQLKAQTDTHVLFLQSQALKEPVAWGGPIVMNTNKELGECYFELNQGTFLKKQIKM